MIANAKKVICIEKLQGPIPTELFKLWMAGHQNLEILRTLMPKVAKFLERIHMDIERLLPVLFLNFWFFFSIGDNL